ncbi:MAG TPA: ATP-dependent Clp protease adaptor ClpS [Phycisphaerales bacterium]|nr:ATP-dependent Clp protease adaptor ClpS [Phycisphaerales bacterium]
MPTQSSAATATAASTRTAERAKQPWLWNVVLLNDDEHSYDYVITMLKTVFAHPEPRGMQIAKRVDKHGRAVVLTTHKEHAELKLDQIHAFGRDRLIAACAGSMSAIIEPAEFEGDSDVNDPHSRPPQA